MRGFSALNKITNFIMKENIGHEFYFFLTFKLRQWGKQINTFLLLFFFCRLPNIFFDQKANLLRPSSGSMIIQCEPVQELHQPYNRFVRKYVILHTCIFFFLKSKTRQKKKVRFDWRNKYYVNLVLSLRAVINLVKESGPRERWRHPKGQNEF